MHDRNTFKSYTWALALIAALVKLYPKDFKWLADAYEFAYEFVKDVPAIDLLYGSSEFREIVDGKGSLEKVLAENKAFEGRFIEARDAFLLYR